jgi:RNA polymerase sigma-70 factor (ECF subfamily)
MVPNPSIASPAAGVSELGVASFRAFYDEALPRVYGYFLRRCGGVASVAEELTQETFTAAVRELRRGRAVEAPLPWIYGIARHKLLDHYRRERRGAGHVSINDTIARGLAVDSDADRVREITAIALAAVPQWQRAALVLRHVDGCSVPEVAAALGRSVEAVESLLARGRVSFKRAYLEASQ